MRLSKRTLDTAQAIVRGLAQIKNVRLIGTPVGSVFAFQYGSDADFDSYRLADELSAKGWHMTKLQNPPGIHWSLTAKHAGMEQRFLADVATAVKRLDAEPELHRGQNAAVYGVTSALPGSVSNVVVSDLAATFCETMIDHSASSTSVTINGH